MPKKKRKPYTLSASTITLHREAIKLGFVPASVACEALSCHRSDLEERAKSREIASKKVGRERWYSRDDLSESLEAEAQWVGDKVAKLKAFVLVE